MTERATPRVDFHIHVNPLDSGSGFRIIDKAADNNIKAMTLLARSEVPELLPAYQKYAHEKEIDLVSGIENFTEIDGIGVDIVGLGFDITDPLIRQKFSKEGDREANKQIAHKQSDFLKSQGFLFDNLGPDLENKLQTVLNGDVSEKAIRLCEIVSANSENESLIKKLEATFPEEWTMVMTNYSERHYYQEDKSRLAAKLLYNLYFAKGKPGSISPMHSEQFISIINQAGGVALYSPEGNFDPNVWEKLKAHGIDGVMAWHGGKLGADHGTNDIPKEKLIEMKNEGYLILGGSDYSEGGNWEVGSGDGSFYMSERRYKELKDALNKKHTPADKVIK